MGDLFFLLGMAAVLIWFFLLRPYCRRHGKGITQGTGGLVPFWVDWQEAWDIAKAKGDRGMVFVCRVVLGLQLAVVGIVGVIFVRLRLGGGVE
jgi:hypothetical protein